MTKIEANKAGTGIINIKDASVSFGRSQALGSISLSICQGESLAILGPNGSGKSTLLRLISGEIWAGQGQVDVLGISMNADLPAKTLRSLRSRIGRIHQGLNLVGRLTAFENVLAGRLATYNSPWSWLRRFPAPDRQIAMDSLEAVGMAGFKYARTDRLSGGERQKVAIARALAQKAEIILADEPTASLDPSASEAVSEILVGLTRKLGITLITTQHDISLALQFSDRIVGLRSGKIVFAGPSDNFDETYLMRHFKEDSAEEDLGSGGPL